MFGLDQQVQCRPVCVSGVVDHHHAFGGTQHHHGADTMSLHFHLCGSDRRTTRANDLAHRGDGVSTKTKCSDSGWTIGAVHLVDTQHATHHQDAGVDLTGAVW